MNRYKQIIDRVQDSPNVERMALAAPHAGKPMRPLTRLAGIAVACCMLLALGVMMWPVLFPPAGDDTLLPGAAGLAEEPGMVIPEEAAPEGPLSPFIVSGGAQFSPSYSFGYRVFAGPPDKTYDLTPRLFDTAETLRAFIDENELLEGQGQGEYACDLPDTVDFSLSAVVAVCGFASSSQVLLAPVIETDYNALPASGLLISRQLMYPDAAGDTDPILRGYFLIVDRNYIRYFTDANGNPNVKYADFIYDFASFPDLTPDELRDANGVRVYEGLVKGLNSEMYTGVYTGSYIMQPHVVMQSGFGCTGVYAAEDFSYIVLTYTYPNATQPIGREVSDLRKRAHFSIMWLGQETQMYFSGNYYDLDLTFEPLGGDRWQMLDENGRELTVMTVTPDRQVIYD